jgi:tetratricopeptide (TPR) repeat protein
MKTLIAIGSAILLLAACDHPGSVTSFTLSESALFNSDSVQLYLANASLKESDSSQKIFLTAIDLLKNKNNAEKSISVFLKALSIYPTAKAYYELGNAYLDAGDAGKALTAFQMAGKLDYTPLGALLFKQACCYSELNDERMYDYITYAVENGFTDRDKILGSDHFAKYKNDLSLLNVYNEAMKGNGDADMMLWQGYSREFEALTFPLSIDSGSFRALGEARYISFDYDKFIPEMRDDRFSRDVGNNFFYYGMVKANAAFKTLIYGCESYESSGAPVYYLMASFNTKGKLVDKKLVAGSRTFEDPFKVLSMPADDRFEIQEYKNSFEKDPDKEGFQGNKITRRELLASHKYNIDSTGKFTEIR